MGWYSWWVGHRGQREGKQGQFGGETRMEFPISCHGMATGYLDLPMESNNSWLWDFFLKAAWKVKICIFKEAWKLIGEIFDWLFSSWDHLAWNKMFPFLCSNCISQIWQSDLHDNFRPMDLNFYKPHHTPLAEGSCFWWICFTSFVKALERRQHAGKISYL